MATLFMAHWAMAGITGEGDWLFTKWAILSTWLLTSSTEVTFWWAFTWDASVFISFTYLERSIHILPQMSFSRISQSCSFQVSDHPASLRGPRGYPYMETNCEEMRIKAQSDRFRQPIRLVKYDARGFIPNTFKHSIIWKKVSWCTRKFNYIITQLRDMPFLPGRWALEIGYLY